MVKKHYKEGDYLRRWPRESYPGGFLIFMYKTLTKVSNFFGLKEFQKRCYRNISSIHECHSRYHLASENAEKGEDIAKAIRSYLKADQMQGEYHFLEGGRYCENAEDLAKKHGMEDIVIREYENTLNYGRLAHFLEDLDRLKEAVEYYERASFSKEFGSCDSIFFLKTAAELASRIGDREKSLQLEKAAQTHIKNPLKNIYK